MTAYELYLAGERFPVTPSKVKIKTGNQNKTMTLINESEINLLKAPGLRDISFDILLPRVRYPFAVYPDGFKEAEYYIALLEGLKESKGYFIFTLTRTGPSKNYGGTSIKVSMEDLTFTEDAKEGLDVTASVSLKEFRDYGTKIVVPEPEPEKSGDTDTVTLENTRENTSAPVVATYTIKSGDTLWNIAKQHLGDGSRYNEIYNLNTDKLKSPNLIYPGQVLTMPG